MRPYLFAVILEQAKVYSYTNDIDAHNLSVARKEGEKRHLDKALNNDGKNWDT